MIFNAILVMPFTEPKLKSYNNLSELMKLILTIILLIFILANVITYGTNPDPPQRPASDANIFGHVLDLESGEHLPFVNLIIKGTRIGTMTDATGHYLLTNLPVGQHKLVVQSLGFETAEVSFEIREKQTLEIDIEVRRKAIDLEGIVLTASPTSSGFRYQPDAVLLGETLQRHSEISFGEMLNGQPGVAMRSMGSAPARPVIRGLDGDRILVLENGERMGDISETSADHAISLDPLAASRVEVVRGPASLLYGSSALGGVINLMTTDIPQDWDHGFGGVISGQGASMNSMGAVFARSTYGSETWAGTARFAFRKAGDILTPVGKIPGTHLMNYDGALGFGLNSSNIKGGFSFSTSDQSFGIPDFLEMPELKVEIRARRNALQVRFQRQFSGFFDQAQLRFNASRFLQHEVEIVEPVGGIKQEEVLLKYDQLAFSSTLTIQHKPVSFFDRGAMGLSIQGRILDVIADDAYTPGDQRLSIGLFTFQEVPLSVTTRLQFGVRVDFQNVKARSNESFADVNMIRSTVNYSGSFGLNYRPIKGLEIGGQFARSHRNPSIEELYANGAHLGAGVFEKGNLNLKDEIGHGGDLFLSWEGKRISLEVTGFINQFMNFIVFQPTGQSDEVTGYPIVEYQGAEARLIGSELQVGYKLTESLALTSTMDYVNGKRLANGNEGEYLPFIPPFRVSSELEYNRRSYWVGSRLQAVARQNRVAPEEAITDGYILLGFVAGYRFDLKGRHVFILRIDNALDAKYRDHLSRMEDRNFLMPGRNFTLAYRWFF